MSGRLIDCPVCGSPLETQAWAERSWVDCPSMHRLTVDACRWDELCRGQLLREIREFLAGLPPVPGRPAEGM